MTSLDVLLPPKSVSQQIKSKLGVNSNETINESMDSIEQLVKNYFNVKLYA